MAKNPLWRDEYWLLLLQLYLRKPVGLKPMYSRQMVDLGLELHLHPRYLYDRMFRLRQLDTPMLQRLWDTYGNNPRRLQRATRLLRHMYGFGQADIFYQGVEVNETFERDWRPLEENPTLTIVKLVLILDLYFRLTPVTMVRTTPEIVDLGRLIRVPAEVIEEVMSVYRTLDPYLSREDFIISRLLGPCSEVWRRYANLKPGELEALAAQLKEYFE